MAIGPGCIILEQDEQEPFSVLETKRLLPLQIIAVSIDDRKTLQHLKISTCWDPNFSVVFDK
ncbi:hypothetical protein EJB05_13756, partial [Eragrostis curvula]